MRELMQNYSCVARKLWNAPGYAWLCVLILAAGQIGLPQASGQGAGAPPPAASQAPVTGQVSPATPPPALPSPRYIPSHDFHTENILLNLHFDFDLRQAIG